MALESHPTFVMNHFTVGNIHTSLVSELFRRCLGRNDTAVLSGRFGESNFFLSLVAGN